MRLRILALALAAAAAVGWQVVSAAENAAGDNDPYLWLSDINGAKALDWVKAQNARSDAALKNGPGYRKDYDALLQILNSNDRIPLPDLVDHQWVFNFWQDADHARGLWRRTSVADYAKPNPDWQVLFDVDKYDRDTGKNWVWQGADCSPGFTRCLV
jgi:prolyl oligopeptidase